MADNNTRKFKEWAREMGCPLHLLPSDDILKRTFGTQQGQCLIEVVRRVAPSQKVATMRSNVLLHKLQKGSNGGAQDHSAVTKSLEKLREKREELRLVQQHNVAKRKQLEALRESTSQLNQKHVHEFAQQRIERANIGLLTTKLRSLDNELQSERTTTTTTASLMPVHFNAADHSLAQAHTAIVDTIKAIHSLYQSDTKPNPNPIPMNATNPTWTRLQRTVAQQPNSLLWSAINDMQKQNLATIKRLSTESSRTKHFVNDPHSSREFLDRFMVKARAKHLSIEFARVSVVHELERSLEEFIGPYDAFIGRMYTDDTDSDLVEEYLAQITMHSYNCGQLAFLNAEVEAREAELAERSAQLDAHSAAMHELQRVYAEVSATFHQTRDECAVFYSVKHKLQSMESCAKGLVLEARQMSQRAMLKPAAARALNSSSIAGGGDSSSGSFNLSINGVLSSTRLDCWPNENSMLMLSTMEPRNDAVQAEALANAANVQQPQHLNELRTYVEGTLLPLALHSSTIDTLQHIVPENLVQMHSLQLDLYRMQSIHQSITDACAWKTQLDRILDRPPLLNEVPDFDQDALHQRAADLHQHLAGLEDQCQRTATRCHQQQAVMQRLAAFLYDNSLRLFVPAAHTFNGRSYADYEREYLSWYNMVVAGGATTAI